MSNFDSQNLDTPFLKTTTINPELIHPSELYINARLRVKTNVVTRIKRQFPSPNPRFTVRVGDEVIPNQLLGEGRSAAGFRTIHLAYELRVAPQEAIRFLKRKIGQAIFQGEKLAEKEQLLGFGNKILVSPVDGVIDYYDENRGDLRIKQSSKIVKVPSGVYGIVDQIDEDAGSVDIKTMGSVVYGLVGSGRSRQGLLKVIGSRDDLIGSRHVDETMEGQIIVGGSMIFAETLFKAVGVGISGIITGGINGKDYRSLAGGEWGINKKHWSDVGFSLIVTEGFGSAAIGEDIFGLLKKYDGKLAIINGNNACIILPSDSPDCMIYIRKTELPNNFESESRPTAVGRELKIGQPVRLVTLPNLGEQAIVVAIDKAVSMLPSGVQTVLITVETKSKKLRVPYQNLEIII